MKWNNVRGSTPLYIPNFLHWPDQYVDWSIVDECLYRRDLHWEIIAPDGHKKEIPSLDSAWYGEYEDIRFVTQKVKRGYGFVITKFGRYNKLTNDLCREVEEEFSCVSDIHVYGGFGDASSFNPHRDATTNVIIQVDGQTPWVVFNDDLEPELEVTLTKGDLLYIPFQRLHQAKPSGTRLSMSIAMIPPELKRITIDRGPLTMYNNKE